MPDSLPLRTMSDTCSAPYSAAYGWAAGHERKVFLLPGWRPPPLLLVAMPHAGGLFMLSLIRFAAGVASAFVMIFCTTILFSHFDRAGRNDLQALHFGGVGLGLGASALLLVVLIATQAHWAVGWYASAIIALVGSLAAALSWCAPIRCAIPISIASRRCNGAVPLVQITIAYGLFRHRLHRHCHVSRGDRPRR